MSSPRVYGTRKVDAVSHDVLITVVIPATLYRMKRDTVRMRDRDDALHLSRKFGLDDDTGD